MDETLNNELDNYIDKLQRLKQLRDRSRKILPRKRRPNLPALAIKSTSGFLIHCALVRTLRRHLQILAFPSYVAIFTAPENWELDQIKEILQTVFKDHKDVQVRSHPFAKSKRGWDFEAADWLQYPKLIVVAGEGSIIHEDMELAMTVRDRFELGDTRHVQAVARLRRCGDVTAEQAQFIAQQPAVRLEAIFRVGLPFNVPLERLRKERGRLKATHEVNHIDISVGFGEAGAWASDFEEDINDWRSGKLPWSDVDKGCLLFGPPGTGKTRFAASLAAKCDLFLEATSVSRWQGNRDGALGDMLNAMYKSFAKAKASAPAMLFIDEFDSIGDRNKFPGRHVDYSTQVVNALLECLDGVEGHEGVIVVAACNKPSRIDPALLRGGRLEKHIFFPLPDANARAAILAYYLPQLAAEPTLKEIAARMPDKSGADLERLSREAKRAARKEKRPITIDDVVSGMERFPTLNGGQLYRIAVHETGHAIVAYMLKVGRVTRVEIFDNVSSFATEIDAHGITVTEHPKAPFTTMKEKKNLICMHLAGAAAEEFLFDDRSSMSAGSLNSDFAKATHEAIEMITGRGLGNTPFFLPDAVDKHSHAQIWQDTGLKAEVTEILQAEFERAKEILRNQQNALIRFAGHLLKRKRIEGNALDDLWPGAIYRKIGVSTKL